MARLGGPSKLGNVTKKMKPTAMEWCQGSEFFFAKKPACKFTIIYHPPVLWKTMIVYICMTMEIKKWKLFISFLALKTSKAEKNSSQPFGPSKKAIFSRQINPRRLGKPNGVHHELSRIRATGCSSKFWILLSSVHTCSIKDFFWFFEMEELGASEANHYNLS